MATLNDEYNGFFIPAGTIIVGNSWSAFFSPACQRCSCQARRGILHDPDVYPDPHRFVPERFVNHNNDKQHLSPADPLSVAFGYGRRACPGRFMAEAQVWMSIACILSAFEITPAIDTNGSPIKVVPSFSSGMIS